MPDQKTKNKYGATPGKLVLIGVLAVVLLIVVYRNFFSGTAPASRPAGTGRGETEVANGRPSVADGVDADSSPRRVEQLAVKLRSRPWPEYALVEVGKYDPFALPTAFPQPQKITLEDNGPVLTSEGAAAALAARRAEIMAAQAAAAEAIRQQGVQVIFKNADEFVAVIGDREIRVGDEVEGFVVVEIGNGGVTLDRMQAK